MSNIIDRLKNYLLHIYTIYQMDTKFFFLKRVKEWQFVNLNSITFRIPTKSFLSSHSDSHRYLKQKLKGINFF